MTKACNKCKKKKTCMFYTSLQVRLCQSCFDKDKKTRRSLIRKLKTIPEIMAPLGYSQVGTELFLLPAAGRQYTEKLFLKPSSLVVH